MKYIDKDRNEVVDILNKKKIKTPMEHIKKFNDNKKWNIEMINGILKNRVYTGDLIQQKRKRVSFKNHRFIKTQDNELIITKNDHIAIITKEQFERVQTIIKKLPRIGLNKEYDLFLGYLKCAKCNSNLTIWRNKGYIYYACSSYVRKRGCDNKNTIRKDILEKNLIDEINNKQIATIDKLSRKYINDLINVIYIEEDGSVMAEYKK